MTISIQYLPRELLGDMFSFLDDPNDLIDCTRVCKDWNETIKTNVVSKKLVANLFPDADLEIVFKDALTNKCQNTYYYYEVVNAVLKISQHPMNFKIRSNDIDKLSTIAAGLQNMSNSAQFYNHPEYKEKVSDKLAELPERIQQNLYIDLGKVFNEAMIIISNAEWGRRVFHNPDTKQRFIPSYRIRKEIVLDQVEEEKLRTVAHTLMHDSSERNKEKAIKQFSQFPSEKKEAVYQSLKLLLINKGLFNHDSGKSAFYDSRIPKEIKGAAIHMYLYDVCQSQRL